MSYDQAVAPESPDEPVSSSRHGRILSIRTIAICAALLVLVAAAGAWLLLANYGDGSAPNTTRLDGIRTVGTIVLGAGGAIVLLLAARRQQVVEHRELAVLEHAGAANEAIASARRITELYTEAADQLGSDRAPLRQAGLYALERVAEANASQRQTVVATLCAYLRMPCNADAPTSEPPSAVDPPSDTAGVEDLPMAVPSRAEVREQAQERQVRLTAQRILTDHLKPRRDPGDPTTAFWPGIELDLTGATLFDFTLDESRLGSGQFEKATFIGDAGFDRATFDGDARFGGATFTGAARFDRATFDGTARFDGVIFSEDARFDRATFDGTARFDGVTFSEDARFGAATFTGDARFDDATFDGKAARFGEAIFDGAARFDRATFDGTARFGAAIFDGAAWFDGATFDGIARFDDTTFDGDAWFGAATFTGDARFDGATFDGDAGFGEAIFDGAARFDDAIFDGVAWFGAAIFEGDAGFGEATLTRYAQFEEAWARGTGSSWPAGWTLSVNPGVPWPGAEGEWRQVVQASVATSTPDLGATTVKE